MATANEQLQDLQIANQHLVEEYKNELSSTLLMFFRRMEKLIKKEITTFYDEETHLQKDKAILKRNIKKIYDVELNKIHKRLMTELEKLLGSEAKNYTKQLKTVLQELSGFITVKSVDEKTLKKTFEKEKLNLENGQTMSLATMWMIFYDRVRKGLNENLDAAYTLGKTGREFTSDVNHSFKINENQLNAIILTMLHQAYNVAKRSVNNTNDEFVRGYVWDAVMDSRTSDFCIHHNQRVWIYGRPDLSTLEYEIYPPAHHRCRSIASPIIKSYRELDIPASDLTKTQRELIPNSTVSVQSYEDWFNKQSSSIQKEVLGPVRYDAWKKGGLDFSGFYTNNGRKLTLKELQKKQVKISEEYLRYIKE